MPKDSLSKKIRDVKRLLALDTLPETTRSEKERALRSLMDEKAAGATKREESKMTQRYKMVKFVEHQKALRKLEKAKKELAKAEMPEEKGALTGKVRSRMVDVFYIENFPTLEKYISLYKEIDASSKSAHRRAEVWKMAEAKTLKKTRERKTEVKQVDEEDQEADDFFE